MTPEFEGQVTVEAVLSPSEDPSKVAAAVRHVLGEGVEVHVGRKGVRGESKAMGSLVRLHDQLRDRHVRSAARRLLFVSREKDSVSLMLNRQAAAVGVLALCGSAEESPLGPIIVTIRSKKIDGVVYWLTSYEPA